MLTSEPTTQTGYQPTDQDKMLFWGCFIALITTSTAFILARMANFTLPLATVVQT